MGQSWNQCLTARHAVKRLPAIGTLLAGVVEDLQRLREGEPSRAKYTLTDGLADRTRAAAAELLAEHPLYPGLDLG